MQRHDFESWARTCGGAAALAELAGSDGLRLHGAAATGSAVRAAAAGGGAGGAGEWQRWRDRGAGSGAVTTVARLRRRRGKQRDGVVGLIGDPASRGKGILGRLYRTARGREPTSTCDFDNLLYFWEMGD
ncbi:hypothetical protein Scep_024060 [Stephania cephalantha]|uniref:Uncharacterized protein n=1 Tax=Stephania cephalantha TaxID=152367 RepID=A0AAP0EVU1_9MAGN